MERIERLIEFAKKHRLKMLVFGDIEIEFFSPDNSQAPAPATALESVSEREPSEDEMLFYSTSTFDHLREDRNAKD